MSEIAKVIKYEGDNSTFIRKHPAEDFNSLSQLIVHESQEAVFFMNGQALDLFGPGRYTLETENIPLIGKALKRTTGDKSPSTARYISSTKPSRWRSSGERTAKCAIWIPIPAFRSSSVRRVK